ncbi:unnamed protein product [Urochloa decumbens]|uniref:Uncharacterized protein n=1 Tax=Urochloa decumbens TaxID=240449 RepID=A0ABC9GC29_9POAL
MFVLLHGPHSGGGEPGRILHTNAAGHANLYDAGSRSVVSVPDLGKPKGYTPIPFAIAGAGEEESRLYVLRSVPWSPHTHTTTTTVTRHLLLRHGEPGMVARRRLEAAVLYGKAEYIPELETWVRFSPDYPHHLCAADLSGVATMAAPLEATPALQHVWEDFNPPATEETSLVLNKRFPGIVHTTKVEWSAWELHLASLGCGRFCVAEEFHAEEKASLSCSFDDHQWPKGAPLTVLIGVEVVGEGGQLRMVKHKSKRIALHGNNITCML